MYLAQKYGQLPESLEQRAKINQWILFANATLLAPLNQILQNQPFLLGDRFSVADVAVGSVLAYIPILRKLDLSFFPEEVVKSLENLALLNFDDIRINAQMLNSIVTSLFKVSYRTLIKLHHPLIQQCPKN